jgi:hypothetical protein
VCKRTEADGAALIRATRTVAVVKVPDTLPVAA